MLNKINPFYFKNSIFFIPFFYLLLFTIQSIVGVEYLGGLASIEVIKIFFFGLLVYYLANCIFLYVYGSAPKSKWIYISGFISDKLLIAFFSLYLLLVMYAVISAEKIALVEAFRGARAIEIVEARELFFRARIGIEKYLIYIFSIFSTAIIPYFLMISFVDRSKIAWPIFILFSLTLTISMEKALIFKAFIPLILLSVNKYLPRKIIVIAPLIMVVFLIGMTHLSRGSDNGASVGTLSISPKLLSKGQLQASTHLYQEGRYLTLEDHIYKYYPLRGDSTIGYLTNRIFWIPYVTAYDWIKYFHEELHDVHTEGRTSLFVSKLIGKDQIPIEHLIFDYQFGAGANKTAGSNVNFMIDAFVNFGWVGVLVESMILSLFIFYVQRLNNPAASACLYFFLFQLIGGGFIGTFLGGGLMIFMLLVYVVRPKFLITKNAENV